MNSESVELPMDFDGVFRFTNFTKEDFEAMWGKVIYKFPAEKRTPIIIPSATPQEVQSIRKKFAKELAIREFYKTPKFVAMNAHTPGGTPALYTEDDLAPFIQRCLEPLPAGKVVTKVLPPENEDKFRKDRKGKNVSKVLDQDESLVGDGMPMA